MAKLPKDRRPVHVWVWLWVTWLVAAVAAPLWVAVVAALLLLGCYALVCHVLPTYDCPRCRGKDRASGWLVLVLAAFFGGHRAGCRSRQCHGGVRIRLGVRWFQPGRAAALAANPGQPERLRA